MFSAICNVEKKNCYLIALNIIFKNIESRYKYQSGYLIMLRQENDYCYLINRINLLITH